MSEASFIKGENEMMFGLMGFDLFSIMFIVIFTLVIGIFVITAIQSIRQWNKNNNSPRLTVPATVVLKRRNVSHHHHAGAEGMHHHHTTTTYYVTFEVESGDRMEMHVSGYEYGQLTEGDFGNLTFQGTRYLEFDCL